MAVNIVDNGKTSRPSVCNAVESCLVHRDIAEDFLPKLKERLDKHHVEIRGCELTRQILGPENVTPADDDDYATEFLDYISLSRSLTTWRRPLNTSTDFLQDILSVSLRKAFLQHRNFKSVLTQRQYM